MVWRYEWLDIPQPPNKRSSGITAQEPQWHFVCSRRDLHGQQQQRNHKCVATTSWKGVHLQPSVQQDRPQPPDDPQRQHHCARTAARLCLQSMWSPSGTSTAPCCATNSKPSDESLNASSSMTNATDNFIGLYLCSNQCSNNTVIAHTHHIYIYTDTHLEYRVAHKSGTYVLYIAIGTVSVTANLEHSLHERVVTLNTVFDMTTLHCNDWLRLVVSKTVWLLDQHEVCVFNLLCSTRYITAISWLATIMTKYTQ